MKFRRQPSWVMPGAKFDIDFENGRYWNGTVYPNNDLGTNMIQSLLTGPGNSIVGYAPSRDGLSLVIFPVYEARIVPGVGLWVENNTTNNLLWCRDLTNAAWTKSNITALLNVTGADLVANSASRLTATANNGTVLQGVTLASGTFTSSCYIKRISGTGIISMTQDNGGTYTDITAQVVSTQWTKITLPTQTLTNPTVGFKIGTSGDVIAVDFTQGEGGSIATTPLVTTTAAQGRFTEEPVFGSVGAPINRGQLILDNITANGSPWSMFVKGSGQPAPVGPGQWLPSDGLTAMSGGNDGSTASFNGNATGGGGATTSNTGVAGLGNINRLCGSINGNTNRLCMNGGPVASGAGTPGTTKYTHCGVGIGGNGISGINGPMARIAFWDKELTDGQLTEFTRLPIISPSSSPENATWGDGTGITWGDGTQVQWSA